MNIHKGRIPIFHFDLYRIDGPTDITLIGYEEYFFDDGISVVEWAEKLGELKPKDSVTMRFKNLGENSRAISICQRSKRGRQLLKDLKK